MALTTAPVELITLDDGVTITVDDNSTALNIISTDADASVGPIVDLYRNSSSPADNDYLARFRFIGRNDNSQDFTAVDFLGRSIDVSDGSEDATLFINVMTGGGAYNRLNITPTELNLNDESRNVDFRVESDGSANAIFVNAGDDRVTFFNSTTVNTASGTADGFSHYSDGRTDISKSGGQPLNLRRRTDGGIITAYYSESSGSVTNVANFSVTTAGNFALDTPNGNFTINENSADADFRVETNNNANAFVIDAGNNTINLGSPTFTTTDGTNNVRLGASAGTSLNGSSSQNVLIGDDAGSAITSGTQNVAIGYDALTSEDTANYNVAIGREALQTQNGGSLNTAVGRTAGKSITDAAYVTLIGAGAGSLLTNGNNNTAVGYEALKGASSSTASSNTAIGYAAMDVVTSAGSNVAVGMHSGGALTSGSANIFIGREAGNHDTAHTTGSNNIIIGAYSDTSAVDADTQVVVGYNVTSQGNSSFTTGKASSWTKLTFGSDTVSSSSDERLKENIQDATAGLSFIKDLRPVTFEWKKANEIPEDLPGYDEDSEERIIGEGKVYHGFVAQEVKTVIDNHDEIKDGFDMWSENHGGVQGIGSGALIPVLVKAIQELSAEIETLKSGG